MTLFLTSHIGGSNKVDGKRVPAALISDNRLIENLCKRWKQPARIAFVAASPDDFEKNDSICNCFNYSFPLSGLSVSEIAVCDNRNEALASSLCDYDVVILSGGHVPTQNTFFKRIQLKERLEQFNGLVIGISAGTMNAASVVYAHPECDGEAVDPDYQRFISGLGLTELMILPHYQSIKNDVLDGLRVFEDIAYPDSMGRMFLALTDGSYVLVENGSSTLYGEAYLIKDGAMKRICCTNESIQLQSVI